MVFADNGFLGPGVDDALRLVILGLVAANVIVLLAAMRILRLATRLLLDVEQFVREVRREALSDSSSELGRTTSVH